MRIKIIAFIVLLSLMTSVSSYSVELLSTPIQNQLKNSILLATDNWELDDDNNKIQSTPVEQSYAQNKKKSIVKAALYSALLPGLGEHYIGNRTKAKVFFATEALTWLSYFAFHGYGEWKKDDMVRFAADNAGASLDGKDDEYFDWVGFYISTEEFNSLGRVSDPDRQFLQGTANYWQWNSEESKEAFRGIKNSSRTAFDRANFMIVAAISARIISVIDAIRDAKKNNRTDNIDLSDKKSYNYKFSIDPLSYNKQFSVTLFTPF